MRKILISLGACVPPVLSAFVMLFIMASIYAQVQIFTITMLYLLYYFLAPPHFNNTCGFFIA
jgi:hypothetical protein